MMKLALSGALAVMLIFAAQAARAQDADEVVKLRAQVEQLQKENELLKKENELLKKEIELQKQAAKAKPDGAKGGKAGALSDLVTEGTVLQGTFRANQGGGRGELTLTVTERDGKKVKATSTLRQLQDNVEVGTFEGQVEGVIDANRLTWMTVGGSNKTNANLLLKGDGLEGTYRTQAGVSGTVGLKFAK